MSPLLLVVAIGAAVLIGHAIASAIVGALDAFGWCYRPPRHAADELAALLDPPPPPLAAAWAGDPDDFTRLAAMARRLPEPEPRPLALRIAAAAAGGTR